MPRSSIRRQLVLENDDRIPIKGKKFTIHLLLNTSIGLLLIIFCLFIGMLGYHFFEHMSWLDAFDNASMILSGMGPLQVPITKAGKVFVGCYALFSGLSFLIIIALIFTPVIHKFLVRAHLESKFSFDDD